MFTKQEYINYFREIEKIENHMIENLKELKTLIKDENIQQIINEIYKDEQNHIELEKEIIKSISDLSD